MRAQNQQDFIYKRRQAGITKASVTIVFDNSDRENSPPGMENYAQISVTRQVCHSFCLTIDSACPECRSSSLLLNISKYLLNGHKAQQNIIQTVFQSVQLNINDPNFLIMQGRITKVRIYLALVRPFTGRYSTCVQKKSLAWSKRPPVHECLKNVKTRPKRRWAGKRSASRRLRRYLRKKITPKLDTLRTERCAFMQFQKASAELERLARVLRAYERKDHRAKISRKEAQIAEKEHEVGQARRDNERAVREAGVVEKNRVDVQTQRDHELKEGGKVTRMEEEAKELERVVVKLRTRQRLRSSPSRIRRLREMRLRVSSTRCAWLCSRRSSSRSLT
jgi:structural maintenance of chromosome 2